MQKAQPNRFFVLNCAVSGHPIAGTISRFKRFNRNMIPSSSLSDVVTTKASLKNTDTNIPDQ